MVQKTGVGSRAHTVCCLPSQRRQIYDGSRSERRLMANTGGGGVRLTGILTAMAYRGVGWRKRGSSEGRRGKTAKCTKSLWDSCDGGLSRRGVKGCGVGDCGPVGGWSRGIGETRMGQPGWLQATKWVWRNYMLLRSERGERRPSPPH